MVHAMAENGTDSNPGPTLPGNTPPGHQTIRCGISIDTHCPDSAAHA